MYMFQNKNQIKYMTVWKFFTGIHIDKFNIQCTVMCHPQINSCKVLRGYCLPSVHLNNSLPFCFMMFILERIFFPSNIIPGKQNKNIR